MLAHVLLFVFCFRLGNPANEVFLCDEPATVSSVAPPPATAAMSIPVQLAPGETTVQSRVTEKLKTSRKHFLDKKLEQERQAVIEVERRRRRRRRRRNEEEGEEKQKKKTRRKKKRRRRRKKKRKLSLEGETGVTVEEDNKLNRQL